MNWIDKLERKYGRYAIKNLVMIITIGTVLASILSLFPYISDIIRMLELDSAKVLKGQVWRLITFVFILPSSGPNGIIFLLFAAYMFYMFGKALENQWGHFKLTLYYIIGMISTIVASFIAGSASAVYLNLSIFLAFAYIYPNFKLLLFFVLPIKIKYLAWLELFFIAYTVIFASLPMKIAAVVSLANFVVFFGSDIMKRWVMPRIANFKKQQRKKKLKIVVSENSFKLVHKCNECGRTSETDPNLKFRYCKECGSDYQYCNDHIHNHNHV